LPRAQNEEMQNEIQSKDSVIKDLEEKLCKYEEKEQINEKVAAVEPSTEGMDAQDGSEDAPQTDRTTANGADQEDTPGSIKDNSAVEELEQLRAKLSDSESAIAELKEEHKKIIDNMQSDHTKTVDSLKLELESTLAREKSTAADNAISIDRIREEHDKQLKELNEKNKLVITQFEEKEQQHAKDMETLLKQHYGELEKMKEDQKVNTG
jgi:hypothetical protein